MTGKGSKARAELVPFGRAVRELRARRDLSQEGLGWAAGLHRNYVGGIERGELNVTFRILMKLAHGLRVPLSELIVLYERNRAQSEGGPGAQRGLDAGHQ